MNNTISQNSQKRKIYKVSAPSLLTYPRSKHLFSVNQYGYLYHEGVWGDDDGALYDDEDDENERISFFFFGIKD